MSENFQKLMTNTSHRFKKWKKSQARYRQRKLHLGTVVWYETNEKQRQRINQSYNKLYQKKTLYLKEQHEDWYLTPEQKGWKLLKKKKMQSHL